MCAPPRSRQIEAHQVGESLAEKYASAFNAQSNARHELKLSPIQLCNATSLIWSYDGSIWRAHIGSSTKSALLQRKPRKSSAENFPCGWLKRPSSLAVGVPEREAGSWFELTNYNSELILVPAPDQQVSTLVHD